MSAEPINDYDAFRPLDVEAIRNDFPILKQETHPPLIYLDSAATS
ncbi:cysteine desulfurase, partial [Candidatus Poribacteria bacterium]|nr:cysteine desulfurase [Candidatus Poribacteria bacterium]